MGFRIHRGHKVFFMIHYIMSKSVIHKISIAALTIGAYCRSTLHIFSYKFNTIFLISFINNLLGLEQKFIRELRFIMAVFLINFYFLERCIYTQSGSSPLIGGIIPMAR